MRIPVLENGKAASFVEYELVLREHNEERGETLNSVWFTWARLNDIDSGLRKRFGRKEVPSFPGRILFRDETSSEVIMERRVELQSYLRDVVPRFRGRDPGGLDGLLAEVRPKLDFSVPRAAVHASVLVVDGEEMWVGLVTEAVMQGLSLLVALRDKLAQVAGLEEQLGLLELNQARREAAAENIRSNLPSLRRAADTPGLPQDTRSYFLTLERMARNAVLWNGQVEASLLRGLEDGTAVSPVSGQHPPPASTPAWTAFPPRSTESPPPLQAPEQAAALAPPLTEATPSGVASIDEWLERADELMLKMLGCSDSAEKAQLVHAKKQLLEHMVRQRDWELANDNDEALRERWRRAVEHVEKEVVFSSSLHDAVGLLEQQLYELIDRRGKLAGGADRKECSSVRRSVVSLRRLLRHIKETTPPRDDDPALTADLNRVTDLQENLAQLQLDMESTFEFDTTVEDIVIDKLNRRVVESAAKEHEQAEEDIFGL